MRISTNTIYGEGISRISAIQAQQVKLQEQISTGKRFNSPADDPIAAARALEISYAMGVNDNYAETRKTAQNNLNILEGNLSSVTNVIVSAQSVLISAGNGGLSDLERGFKATELQSAYESLLGLANAQDASGKYLYSGYKTDTKPFISSGDAPPLPQYEYAGDSNSLSLQVAPNRELAVNATGSSVFQNGGDDVFATLEKIISLLKTPITDSTTQAAFTSGLATAIDGLKGSLNNVLNVRADVGGKLNELDELDVSGAALDLQYQTSLSDIQDLDYAKALSDLSKSEIIMEAAQKSFVSTTQLSLFDFI